MSNHLLITFGLSTLAFAFPMIYPDIIGLLGIFGGTFVAYVCMVVPFLIKIIMIGEEYAWYSR
jgi:hypothetical protein